MNEVVLLDTDVFSHTFFMRRTVSAQGERYRRLLLGSEVVIAAQTEAELRYGALVGGWKAERLTALEARLATCPTLPVTAEVIRAFAAVRAACRQIGHALAAKHHVGDAWIAATAIAYDLPLLTADSVFSSVPGVRRLPEDDV